MPSIKNLSKRYDCLSYGILQINDIHTRLDFDISPKERNKSKKPRSLLMDTYKLTISTLHISFQKA